jgi:hypothetical protein
MRRAPGAESPPSRWTPAPAERRWQVSADTLAA